MANVRKLSVKDLDQARRHSDVEATVGLVEVDGERFIQIDTYGSSEREMPGKMSQSLRLSKDAYDQIVDLGKSFF